MLEQMKRIKDNNFMLPSVNDVKMLEDGKKIKKPIRFI
jgi:hypothetical protein